MGTTENLIGIAACVVAVLDYSHQCSAENEQKRYQKVNEKCLPVQTEQTQQTQQIQQTQQTQQTEQTDEQTEQTEPIEQTERNERIAKTERDSELEGVRTMEQEAELEVAKMLKSVQKPTKFAVHVTQRDMAVLSFLIVSTEGELAVISLSTRLVPTL